MAQILGNIILINNYITTYPVKSISTCSHVFLSKENNAFLVQNHVIYLKLHHLELIIYYCFVEINSHDQILYFCGKGTLSKL